MMSKKDLIKFVQKENITTLVMGLITGFCLGFILCQIINWSYICLN